MATVKPFVKCILECLHLGKEKWLIGEVSLLSDVEKYEVILYIDKH